MSSGSTRVNTPERIAVKTTTLQKDKEEELFEGDDVSDVIKLAKGYLSKKQTEKESTVAVLRTLPGHENKHVANDKFTEGYDDCYPKPPQ